MYKAIIIPNTKKDVDLAVTKKVIDRLYSLGICVLIDSSYGLVSEKTTVYSSPPDNADVIIVIGGDGSVIDASSLAITLDVPILGVNLGRVGYLTEVEPGDLSLLENLISEAKTNEKMLLIADHVNSDGEIISTSRHAVNDVVVSHGDYFGIANFTLTDSLDEMVAYRADALIVSTPVGSTAYSLSAGGPLIAHNLDSITVTPVCPHSFFNRPIVYEPSETLTVTNSGTADLSVSVDGRYFATLKEGERCVIRQSDKKLKMITFSKNNMFSTLFKKIKVYENNV